MKDMLEKSTSALAWQSDEDRHQFLDGRVYDLIPVSVVNGMLL
jgi:hypothetical protein